jgi:uncharacterized YccA/Bax inhibitor family protein
MRTGNPLLRLRTYRRDNDPSPDAADAATLGGVIKRTAVLTVILALACAAPLQRAVDQPRSSEVLFALGAGVVMIYGTIIYTRRAAAPFAASVFAFGVGLMFGALSAYLDRVAGGLWGIAVLGGGATLIAMLWIHGVLRLGTDRTWAVFVHGVVGGAFVLVLIAALLQPLIPEISTTSGRPVTTTLVAAAIIALTSFCLTLDVRWTERGIAVGAPRHLEWYCAVGLLGSLVWTYPEIVRQLTVAHMRVKNDDRSDAGERGGRGADPDKDA